MSSGIINTNLFLDELLEVFFHKFIYYVPNEIIFDTVKEQLKDQIDDDFYDEFYFLDNKLGNALFNNDDASEVTSFLVGKRTFLEQNTFKLVEKRKELTEFEFLVIIEKYYEYLLLFIDITQWLSVNVKKYNGEDVHISIIGGFHMQLQFFVAHLKDICNYFGELLDLEKDYNFTVEQFVVQYLPDILSRYVKIESAQIETEKKEQKEQPEESDNKDNSNLISSEQKVKRKKQRPTLDDKEVEALILAKVFNVEEMKITINNKKN